MTNNRLQHYKPLIILAIFLVVWWVLPVFVKSFMRASLYEFQAPVWVACGKLRDVQDYWSLRNHTKRELMASARDVARANASYELALQEASHLEQEVKRLEALLDLPAFEGYRYEVARVIQRDTHMWAQQLVIRKGSRQDIQVGYGVVYAGGVVGRVVHTSPYTAIVQLITSPEFRIAGQFEDDGRPVVYQGMSATPLEKIKGKVRQIPLDLQSSIEKPRHLVTSRLGGVFPDGLSIGWVYHSQEDIDGLFAKAEVMLDERLNHIKEVAILVPERRI